MAYRYSDGEGELIEGAECEVKPEEVKPKSVDENEYYELPDEPQKRNRLWSVISIAAAVLSVILCSFYYVSLPLAAVAIVGALISRRMLGYFDGLSLAGLFVGLVGIVFGAFSLIVDVTGVLDALKK